FSAGAHNYKFGGEYRRAIVNSTNDVNARGRLNFNSLADFLAGDLAASSQILRGATRRDTFTANFGFFGQDDWKITPRPTLNYVLRYEYLGVFKEQNDRMANFVPTNPAGLVQVGSQGLSDLYQSDRNNFGPRFGFAYDVTGKGRTVVRGGYGLYYDTPSQDFFLLQGFQNGGAGRPAAQPPPGLRRFHGSLRPPAGGPFWPHVPLFRGAPRAPPPPH